MMRILLLICWMGWMGAHTAHAQIQAQEKSMWCWASCIQSCLEQAEVYQSQGQVAARLIGWPQNRPARADELAYVLRTYRFRAWVVPYPAHPQELYATLERGWKLVAFVNPQRNPQLGHFILLQGISPRGLIIVSDPATGETYEQDAQQLYHNWSWQSSIIVGTPL